MSKKLEQIFCEIKSFYTALSVRNVSIYASSCAFYIFLSIVPSVMLAAALLPMSKLNSAELSDMLIVIVPETVASFLDSIILEVYSSSPAILSVSAVATLWSASKAMASIMRGIEHISDDSRKDRYIRLRLRAMLYSVTLLLAIYALIILTVFLNLFISLDIISAGFTRLLSPFILALVLALAYKFIPDRRVAFTSLLPGAAAASVSWTVFTAAYSLWLRISDNFGVYGSLGSVVITLLWLYISVYIMLSGAYLNRFLRKKRPIK